MPPHRLYSNYDDIAWVYNRYWGDLFLETSLAALENLALRHVPRDAVVLDLCCGTGRLVQALAERGCRVTGLDGSREMLKYAQKNAPGAVFILDDARTFTLPPAYHLVVSMYDSLNHVLTPGELNAVFSNVHAALLEGGLFLFDLNTEKGYRENWNGYSGIVENDHVCITQNSYSREERIAKFEATIFRLENHWRRSDVLLPERCYSVREVRSALKSSGFINIFAYEYNGKAGFRKLTGRAERAFFICLKP